MVRGAARGITVPTNLSVLWNTLQKLLQEMDGASGVAVEASFFQSLFNGLLREGEALGSLRAGTHWTPTVGAILFVSCPQMHLIRTMSSDAHSIHFWYNWLSHAGFLFTND